MKTSTAIKKKKKKKKDVIVRREAPRWSGRPRPGSGTACPGHGVNATPRLRPKHPIGLFGAGGGEKPGEWDKNNTDL